MKIYLLLLLSLSIFPGKTFCQNADEWLRQKTTQIKYLVQQIGGLQVYIELGREAYQNANDGHQLVSSIRSGEFDLHDMFFHSKYRVHSSLRTLLPYRGPCEAEYELLLKNNYYQLSVAERISRILELRKDCIW